MKLYFDVQSLKPDGTQYKGFDVQLVPASCLRVWVEVPDDKIKYNEDAETHMTDLETLFRIASQINIATRVVEVEHKDNLNKRMQNLAR